MFQIRQFLFKLFFYEEHRRLICAESNFESLCGHIESGILVVDPAKIKTCPSIDVDPNGWDISGIKSFAEMGEYLRGVKWENL